MVTTPVERMTDSVFGERIRDARRRGAFRAKHRVARFVHDRNRDDFLIAQADQTLAQAVLGFGIFQARRGQLRRGQPRRKFVDPVKPGDLFDQVDLARDVAAPRRAAARPHRHQRSRAALRRRPRARAQNPARRESLRSPRPARPRPSRAEIPCASARSRGLPCALDKRPPRPPAPRRRPTC